MALPAQREMTKAQWLVGTQLLLAGQVGLETDTKKFKIGDGSTNWVDLAYYSSGGGGGSAYSSAGRELASARRQSQFNWSTQDWFEVEGLQFRGTTTDGPAYLSLNLGVAVVNGTESVNVGYRIINTTTQKVLAYSTTNIPGNSIGYNSGYLNTLTGRVPNGTIDQRFAAQIQGLGNFSSAYIIPSWLDDAAASLYLIGA